MLNLNSQPANHNKEKVMKIFHCEPRWKIRDRNGKQFKTRRRTFLERKMFLLLIKIEKFVYAPRHFLGVKSFRDFAALVLSI